MFWKKARELTEEIPLKSGKSHLRSDSYPEHTEALCSDADRHKYLQLPHSAPLHWNSSSKVLRVKRQKDTCTITVCHLIPSGKPEESVFHQDGKSGMGLWPKGHY